MTATTTIFTLAQDIAAAPPVAGRTDAPGVGSATQPLGPQGSAPPPSGFGGLQFLLPLLLVMGFMIAMQVFAARKDKKRRAEMLGALRRGDRVVTIGGVIGAVAEVRDDEVVLKVDEATNAKIRVTRNAVQSIIAKGSDAAASAPQPQAAAV